MFIVYRSIVCRESYNIAYSAVAIPSSRYDPITMHKIRNSRFDKTFLYVNNNLVVHTIPVRFMPKDVLSYSDASAGDILKRLFTYNEISSIMKRVRENAATTIQRYVIQKMYTPPMGVMYRKLSTNFKSIEGV